MVFKHVRVIMDSHDLLFSGSIKIADANCFLEPTDIQTAEMFEERFEAWGIPYVLAQVETELAEPARYRRGYALFIEIDSIADRMMPVSDRSETKAA